MNKDSLRTFIFFNYFKDKNIRNVDIHIIYIDNINKNKLIYINRDKYLQRNHE